MPRWGSKREAQAFAASQRAWVEAQRARIARLRAEREAALASRTPAERAALADAERSTRRRARHELPARLLQLAAELGLRVSKISVRNQKWRWGSCSPSGHICLNWRLAAMPDWVRDYVLIHELMHLKRMDHSKKYWALVAAVCPSYKDARAWLRAHGEALR
jgi:predicted metal-dependent hydrolase